MKRRLLKLAAFLLAGAIVNVAVAWGCVVYPRRAASFRETLQPQGLVEFGGVRIYTKPGFFTAGKNGPGMLVDYATFPKRISAEEYDKLIPTWSAFYGNQDPTLDHSRNGSNGYDVLNFGELAGGWPLLSLRSWAVNYGIGVDRSVGEIILPDWTQRHMDRRIVPSIPIWPGFAINTIFYAAILWMIFFASGGLRRVLRRRRGQCPACGYSIAPGTGQVCSECGSPLSTT